MAVGKLPAQYMHGSVHSGGIKEAPYSRIDATVWKSPICIEVSSVVLCGLQAHGWASCVSCFHGQAVFMGRPVTGVPSHNDAKTPSNAASRAVNGNEWLPRPTSSSWRSRWWVLPEWLLPDWLLPGCIAAGRMHRCAAMATAPCYGHFLAL
jgi:hypothetical protein